MGAPGEQGVNVSIFTDVSLLSDVLMVKDHVCSLRGSTGVLDLKEITAIQANR